MRSHARLLPIIALATLLFRHGRWPLRYDSRMFDDLGMLEKCPWPVNVPGTGWPDGLPPEGPSAP